MLKVHKCIIHDKCLCLLGFPLLYPKNRTTYSIFFFHAFLILTLLFLGAVKMETGVAFVRREIVKCIIVEEEDGGVRFFFFSSSLA